MVDEDGELNRTRFPLLLHQIYNVPVGIERMPFGLRDVYASVRLGCKPGGGWIVAMGKDSDGKGCLRIGRVARAGRFRCVYHHEIEDVAENSKLHYLDRLDQIIYVPN